jgi:hypothetical protein
MCMYMYFMSIKDLCMCMHVCDAQLKFVHSMKQFEMI